MSNLYVLQDSKYSNSYKVGKTSKSKELLLKQYAKRFNPNEYILLAFFIGEGEKESYILDIIKKQSKVDPNFYDIHSEWFKCNYYKENIVQYISDLLNNPYFQC